ncbi:MAG: hypothetical protein ACXWQO_16970 [Bdellovibrionota bacterium]
MKLILAACFFFLIAATVAIAAEEKGKPNIIYRKKSAVSFDDAVVEGGSDNPEGIYVVTPPEKQFGSLLKLRPNFHRELMRDSLLLK